MPLGLDEGGNLSAQMLEQTSGFRYHWIQQLKDAIRNHPLILSIVFLSAVF
jgi:hypothetical protein